MVMIRTLKLNEVPASFAEFAVVVLKHNVMTVMCYVATFQRYTRVDFVVDSYRDRDYVLNTLKGASMQPKECSTASVIFEK